MWISFGLAGRHKLWSRDRPRARHDHDGHGRALINELGFNHRPDQVYVEHGRRFELHW